MGLTVLTMMSILFILVRMAAVPGGAISVEAGEMVRHHCNVHLRDRSGT
jgi:hypothetical protein